MKYLRRWQTGRFSTPGIAALIAPLVLLVAFVTALAVVWPRPSQGTGDEPVTVSAAAAVATARGTASPGTQAVADAAVHTEADPEADAAVAAGADAVAAAAAPEGKVTRSSAGPQVAAVRESKTVQLGIDVLLADEGWQARLRGKRVGLVTNQAAVDARLQATADRLAAALPRLGGGKLAALFAPEHGLRGDRPAGQTVPDEIDPVTGVKVYSLYGSNRAPTPTQLQGLDLLIIDLPDIGWRHYTYISTMAYVLQAAAKARLPVLVLDRPNPTGGEIIEGPVAEPDFLSFVSIYPIPLRHGMTMGELALYFNREFKLGAQVEVVPMKGWQRWMLWADTGLPWVSPSPQIPTPEAALLFGLGGVLGETLNLSDGVGTAKPFSYLGAEWIDPFRLAAAANAAAKAADNTPVNATASAATSAAADTTANGSGSNGVSSSFPGLYFRPTYIVPFGYKFKDKRLGAVEIHLVNPRLARPAEAGIELLALLQKLWPGKVQFPTGQRNMFDLIVGTAAVRKQVVAGSSAVEILAGFQEELERFAARRQAYLLY